MSNPNYIKGVRKERKLVNEARKEGLIAFRSAGSHSPIDVCIIDPKHHCIRFIQCKPDNWIQQQVIALLATLPCSGEEYRVIFEVQ